MSDKKLYCAGLFIAVVAFPIFGCVFKWRPDMITPYLLFLTLVAIFWYSYETRGLKKQMILQNELSFRPRLIFIKTAGRTLSVKNIGNGAALDIQIKDYAFELEGIPGRILYRFECQNFLEADDVSDLNIKTGEGEGAQDADFIFLAQLELHTFELTLNYKNIMGKVYSEDTSMLGKDMLQKVSLRK